MNKNSLGGLSVLIFLLTTLPLGAESFRFQYLEDAKYRIVSEVHQQVMLDNEPILRSVTLNRIAVTCLGATDDSGRLQATYQISEQVEGQDTFLWQEENTVVYRRDLFGVYSDVPVGSGHPAVRHIPTFPEEDLEAGDTWVARGEEIHDFLPSFGIDRKVTLPFNVFYEYEGTEEQDGRTFQRIKINYNIYSSIEWTEQELERIPLENYIPWKLVGSYRISMLWDNAFGRPYAVDESFEIEYQMESGETFLFKGFSEGQAYYAAEMPKEEMSEDIEDDLENLEDITVTETEEGLSLTIENIQFRPDSAILLDSELPKLETIARILSRYPDRDIMVVGHAARLGRETWLQELSEMRAATVSQYFIDSGIRNPSQIVTKGMGSSQPLGDNNTEEGRSRNRRVEIIILEN